MPSASLPYRGEPRPKYPKPGKQIRNLRAEKRLRILIAGVLVFVTVGFLVIMLQVYQRYPTGNTIATMVGVIVFFLFIAMSILDGLRSINRYRKGYDVDISGETKEEDREQTETLNE